MRRTSNDASGLWLGRRGNGLIGSFVVENMGNACN